MPTPVTVPGPVPGPVAARAGRARLVVLALLAANVTWGVLLPLALLAPPSAPAWLLLGVLAAAASLALLLVQRAAVTPWSGPRARSASVAALLALTLALWWPTSAWAAPGQEPWAWLAGTVAGVLPLVLRPPAALGLGTGLVALSAPAALLAGGSPARAVGFALGTAVLVVLLGQVLVWMLRLLVAAEAGRAAEAGLAVSAERLRLAQELHDLLGHRLTVIALRAEVAGDLAASDPGRARAETDAVRELAAATLREVRAAVHGFGTVDLAEQLRTAELVLASAGIRADVDAGAGTDGLDPDASRLMAAVVREAVTNVLRHSDATHVRVGLTSGAAGATLVVVNDGARPASGQPGTGLEGLAARAGRSRGRLAWTRDGGRFEVRLDVVPA